MSQPGYTQCEVPYINVRINQKEFYIDYLQNMVSFNCKRINKNGFLFAFAVDYHFFCKLCYGKICPLQFYCDFCTFSKTLYFVLLSKLIVINVGLIIASQYEINREIEKQDHFKVILLYEVDSKLTKENFMSFG